MKRTVREILNKGQICNSSLFRLHFSLSAHYKLGFIARHSTGNPAKRNYFKRIIREYWRKSFQKGNYIFIMKPALMSSGTDRLRDELNKTAGKIK